MELHIEVGANYLIVWSYMLFCAKVHNFSELASDIWKNKRGFYSTAVRKIITRCSGFANHECSGCFLNTHGFIPVICRSGKANDGVKRSFGRGSMSFRYSAAGHVRRICVVKISRNLTLENSNSGVRRSRYHDILTPSSSEILLVAGPGGPYSSAAGPLSHSNGAAVATP